MSASHRRWRSRGAAADQGPMADTPPASELSTIVVVRVLWIVLLAALEVPRLPWAF